MGKDSVGNIPFVEYNRHRQKKTHIKKKLYLVENETTEKYRETDTLYCSTKEVPEKLSLSCRFDYQ